jgi:glucose-1-phosphate cytidylyltransferase
MKVVILCGGLGTRLREETEFRPKPMVEIGGRPILWHIMKVFGHQGMREFVLCLGYKGNLIKEYFLNYEAMNNDVTIGLGNRSTVSYHGQHQEQDYSVTLVDTGQKAQTGARIKKALRFIDGPRCMVTYGDGLANVDLKALMGFHEEHKKLVTLTTVQAPGRFGVLDTDENGGVQRFREKPTQESWVSAGYMVFERGAFDYLTEDDACILEREPLERLAKDGQLMAYRHHGEFHPMDTYRDHVALNELWDGGKASWKTW